MKILIIGSAGHGKTTVAEILRKDYGWTFEDSSMAAARIFLFDTLKDKYGYKTIEECHADRVNHRAEWFDQICVYNLEDPTKLAKEILKVSDIYVGMRSSTELNACIEVELFDLIVGVKDSRKPRESLSSNDLYIDYYADFIIRNNGDLEDLRKKVKRLFAWR